MTPVKRILVATDFEPAAERALDLGLALAAEFGADLHVVHAYGPSLTDYAASAAGAAGPSEEMAAFSREKLAARVAAARARYPRTSGRAVPGAPLQVILATALAVGADLVVMGTHGRRGVSRALLGSVAESAVRCARIPVLTVSAAEPPAGAAGAGAGAFKHILVPVDLGHASRRAAALAIALASRSGARLTLVHATSILPVPGDEFHPPMDRPRDRLAARLQTELSQFVAETRALFPRAEVVVAEGDPVDVIRDTARDRGCDLIVMGTHGRRGAMRLLGSVAEKTVRTSPVPVITAADDHEPSTTTPTPEPSP